MRIADATPQHVEQLAKALFPMTNPTIYIDRPGTTGIEVEVEGTYVPGERGHRNSMGGQEEPDFSETVEDIAAKVVADACDDDGNEKPTFTVGQVIELTEEEKDDAAAAILEAMAKDEPEPDDEDDYED